MRLQSDDSTPIIRKIEEKHGGRIENKCFSLWFADGKGNIREFGVLVYLINNIWYYEDFYRPKTLFGFKVGNDTEEDFVKLEGSFSADNIKSVRKVTKQKASALSLGKRTSAPTASSLSGLFSELVTEITFLDGSVLYFQFTEKNFISEIINKENKQ